MGNMALLEIDDKLLQAAIRAFLNETGLLLRVRDERLEIGGQPVDAIIEMPERGGKLAVAVKRRVPHANFEALVDQVKRLPMAGVLVADYINPNMAKKLKAMGIQYFDTVGNACINQPPVYVHVTGNKQQQNPVTSGGETNRAFDVAGLKVVFRFLCEPLLVGANYREIAGRTGVAVGTVGWVINGLKGAGYIIDRGGGTGRRLVSRKKLLDRWVETYPEKLKPKLRVGEFVADGPNWWKEIDIEEYGAYWGGEIAAAKYIKYHCCPVNFHIKVI